MGLDIYFYKIDKKYADYPMNTLSETIDTDAKKKFAKKCDRWLKTLGDTPTKDYDQAYHNIVGELDKDPMFKRYGFYLDRLKRDKLNFGQFKEWLDSEARTYYQVSDCYFRKVNFLYAFFKEDMVDECCLVEPWMIDSLIEVCEDVLAHHKKDADDGVEFAQLNLPTQSGCFFGSIEYDGWYWSDVQDCLKQMKKLRKSLKDGDKVYGVFSW